MQELLRHSSFRSMLDVYTQVVTPAKHAAQAAVVSLVFFSDAKGGTMLCRRGKRCQISDDKGFAEESKKDAKRARNVSVLHLQWFE